MNRRGFLFAGAGIAATAALPPAAAVAATPALQATITSQSLAIVDLSTQQALANFEVVAAAGGGPARLRMVSSSLGSAAAYA